jgi:DNA-binding MarR family transcriptional regulator
MKADAKIRPRNVSQSKQRLRLWLRLLRATRAMESDLRERLRIQFGITLPQFDVMAALHRKADGITMTELSRTLIVSNGNVTGIIDRLVADRLVTRRAAADDRRSFLVRLTPKGERQFDVVAKAHQDWVDRLLSSFDGEQAEMIIQYLDGLPSRVRNGGIQP